MVATAAGAVLGSVLFAVGTGVDAEVLAARRVSIRPLDDATLRDRVRPAVLQADVTACHEGRQGTVTVVDLGRGPIGLTNAHLVDGADEVVMNGPGVLAGDGRVEGEVPERDAAVVDLGDTTPSRALRPGVRPVPGDRVLVAGYPGGEYRARSGTVQAIEDRTGRGGTSPVLLVDVDAVPGVSGGVVVDRFGHAVGLVAARDPGTGWTVAYPLGEVLGTPRPSVGAC